MNVQHWKTLAASAARSAAHRAITAWTKWRAPATLGTQAIPCTLTVIGHAGDPRHERIIRMQVNAAIEVVDGVTRVTTVVKLKDVINKFITEATNNGA